MFGDREKCCCCPPRESEVMLHVRYTEKIIRLEAELERVKRIIADLTETNKHLSRQLVKP
jgi:hypothetical protein